MAKEIKGIRYNSAKDLWVGRFMVDNHAYQVSRKSKSECIKALANKRYEVEHGSYFAPQSITLADYCREVIHDDSHITESSKRSYYSYLDSQITGTIGSKKLTDVSKPMLRKFFADMATKDFSTSYIKNVRKVLTKAFNQAVADGLIGKSPLEGVPVAKGKAVEEKHILTEDEKECLIKYSASTPYGNVFLLQMQTGMRIGEVCALQWQDVSFEKKTITVRHTYTSARELNDTKTHEKRTIPMSAEAYKTLWVMRNERAMESIISIDDFVFHSSWGQPCIPTSCAIALSGIIEKIRKDGIKFEDITTHAFRHYFATRCANNGMPPKVLMAILGHKTIALTMELYSHVDEVANAEWMRKMENVI